MNDFLANYLKMPDTARLLFDEMPRFIYFMKDEELRFVRLNQTLVEKLGLPEEEILGKTDYDLLPKSMADAFYKDDQYILNTKKPILNKVELVPSSRGQADWSLTNKVPMFDDEGNIAAIIGATRPFSTSDTARNSSNSLSLMIEFIKENYAKKLSIEDLATMSSLSVSALERKFKKVFHITPSQYILNIRIQEACHLLIHSSRPLIEIASDCGFYDQSHFSRQFSKAMNSSPLKYRKQFRI
ncbi:MAG: AraC family transcriptional regulator [Akkermansiaceae bacterium]